MIKVRLVTFFSYCMGVHREKGWGRVQGVIGSCCGAQLGQPKAVADGAPLDFAGDKPSGSFSQVCQEGCGAVPLSGNVVNLFVGWAGGSCRESGTARN